MIVSLSTFLRVHAMHKINGYFSSNANNCFILAGAWYLIRDEDGFLSVWLGFFSHPVSPLLIFSLLFSSILLNYLLLLFVFQEIFSIFFWIIFFLLGIRMNDFSFVLPCIRSLKPFSFNNKKCAHFESISCIIRGTIKSFDPAFQQFMRCMHCIAHTSYTNTPLFI